MVVRGCVVRIVEVGNLVMDDADQTLLVLVEALLRVGALLIMGSFVLESGLRRNVLAMERLIVDIEVDGKVQGLVIAEMAVDVAAIVAYTFMLVENIGISVPIIVGSPGSQVAVINENEISNGISKS